jgi:hypothetical protein
VCDLNANVKTIGCDSCGEWLHYAFVELTRQEAEDLETYTCPKCLVLDAVIASADTKEPPRDPSSEMKKELLGTKCILAALREVIMQGNEEGRQLCRLVILQKHGLAMLHKDEPLRAPLPTELELVDCVGGLQALEVIAHHAKGKDYKRKRLPLPGTSRRRNHSF